METVKDCHHPWTWMMVTADGSVTPCCFASGKLGNLNEATADQIWNGAIAVELRKFIKADKVHPVCANAPCKYVQNMHVDRGGAQLAAPGDAEEFDQEWYLEIYPDVALAVREGKFTSAWQHYQEFGKAEGRDFRRRDA